MKIIKGECDGVRFLTDEGNNLGWIAEDAYLNLLNHGELYFEVSSIPKCILTNPTLEQSKLIERLYKKGDVAEHNWHWQFPSYTKLPDYYEDAIDLCHEKLCEELSEVITAYEEWNIKGCGRLEDYIVELMDVIHVCETTLRMFDGDLLDNCKQEVIKKNRDRGYYE